MPRPRQSKNTLPISIDPADYGPAMQALTPQQQAFVVAKVLYGMPKEGVVVVDVTPALQQMVRALLARFEQD